MAEDPILKHIRELVEDERRLRAKVLTGELPTDEEQARLRQVEKSLDQCWDLLRRRRAAEDQGTDPDTVVPRPADEVEDYLQ
ncbi:DUF2630 family protein [Planosporangium flavigriseum]|uniref:DUF2630 family protein n=1 Tax=Planosporangium flavigriseum TaxID=373681 RepID=A0A8J3PKF0_9ACTN|nr:DUF2630 family protein [Planosporangium flavigriseum]NJC65353.1 DUF2630 family protein [Planosporangium flavigriseum]GIG73291.1 hypothetical protein Pfl04_16950 [Planosporangium flavigriseum]